MHPTLPVPSVLIQLLDTGTGHRRPKWLEDDAHNYAHLLQATVPRHPALLAVKASLPDLCAYSAVFAPPDALEELTAYLLSWAASTAPFKPLTAFELQRAAASDEGAHRVAELLLQRALLADTARIALLDGFCSSLTRRARHAGGAQLVSKVFRRLLSAMPCVYLSLCLEGSSLCYSPLLSQACRSSRHRASLPQTDLLLLTSCTPWPASLLITGLRVMRAPPMSVACASTTSSSNQSSHA